MTDGVHYLLCIQNNQIFDYSRRVVSYKRKYVHEVLVNYLVKLAQESVVKRTDPLGVTIAVDRDIIKTTTNPTNYYGGLIIQNLVEFMKY